MSEHICRDGYADWGSYADCVNCNPGPCPQCGCDPRELANLDGRWDTWGGDGVGP